MSKARDDIIELTQSILTVNEKMKDLIEDISNCKHCDCAYKLHKIEMLKAHAKSMETIKTDLEIKEKI